VRASIESVFQTGETIRQVVCFSPSGGAVSWREARIGPITQNGRTVAVGVFFVDITEREKLKTKLRETEMLLRSIVKAVPKMMDIMDGLVHHGVNIADPRLREQELELYRAQMIQIGRLISVGKASSSLAHRLPQFLTAISMSVENALARLETVSCPEGVTEELKAALRAVSAVTAGVEQVRGFARTAAKRNLVHRVDLRATVAKVVRLLETQARLANTAVSMEGLDRLPLVRVADGDAEQLLFSLIESIIRSADGKNRSQITISGVVNDQHVELQFSGDDGVLGKKSVDGSLDHLAAAESAGQADGLGFCVAKDVVTQAGGRIWSEGTAEGGPTFFIALPIVDQVRAPME